jgi:hypothetical protein
MENKKIKNVLMLIHKCELNKITTGYIQDNSRMNTEEIIDIFDYLIEDKKVAKYYTIKETSICKVDGINYSSLAKNTKAKHKKDIIKIIASTISVLTFTLYVIFNWDKILLFFGY